MAGVFFKLDLFLTEKGKFSENDFAITDLSHSRTIIEIEGKFVNEVLKKGCPLNIDKFKKETVQIQFIMGFQSHLILFQKTQRK